jgi:serine/threonine protein kinase
MAERLIGQRYRPLERRAIGWMATLWRARDVRTGEIVAVKRLHPYLVTDPAARRRLAREAAALRAVDHPAIVRPRDVIDDPDDPALVMDYAAGRSLAPAARILSSGLRPRRRMPPTTAMAEARIAGRAKAADTTDFVRS